MKLVADEHVPSAVINALLSKGYDVLHAPEEYGQGDDDPELLQNCADNGLVLLTNDRDFVRLADKTDHSGVIIYTDQEVSPREVLRAIIRIDEAYTDDLENQTVWLQGWL
jgi:predicted nuclease of predicted toxin-antitoxin system